MITPILSVIYGIALRNVDRRTREDLEKAKKKIRNRITFVNNRKDDTAIQIEDEEDEEDEESHQIDAKKKIRNRKAFTRKQKDDTTIQIEDEEDEESHF